MFILDTHTLACCTTVFKKVDIYWYTDKHEIRLFIYSLKLQSSIKTYPNIRCFSFILVSIFLIWTMLYLGSMYATTNGAYFFNNTWLAQQHWKNIKETILPFSTLMYDLSGVWQYSVLMEQKLTWVGWISKEDCANCSEIELYIKI